jgi:hypothetical protein
MIWALVLCLQCGTPQEKLFDIGERMTWENCALSAVRAARYLGPADKLICERGVKV